MDSLTEKQQTMLSYISKNPNCTIRELATHQSVTHQSAYERLGQLKRKGLVSTGDKHQKRRIKLQEQTNAYQNEQ